MVQSKIVDPLSAYLWNRLANREVERQITKSGFQYCPVARWGESYENAEERLRIINKTLEDWR